MAIHEKEEGAKEIVAEEYATDSLNKLSPQEVGDILTKLFPEEEELKAILNRLADDILIAAEGGSNSWLLSYHKASRRTRLTASKFAVSECEKNFYSVRIPETRLSGKVLTYVQENGGSLDYWKSKSLDERIAILSFPANLLNYYDTEIKDIHHNFIREVSTKFKASPWLRNHEPALVRWIAEQTGKALPQPDYLYASAIDTSERGYYWLNCNPAQWDITSLPVGGKQSYTSYSEQGNKRRIYPYMEGLKSGDLLIGYETTPGKRVRSLLRITKGLHIEESVEQFTFCKVEDAIDEVTWNELRVVEELSACEPLLQNQGSLFKLTAQEFNIIAEAAGFSNLLEEEIGSEQTDELAQFIREELETERTRQLLADRAKSEELARKLLEERIGSMTADDIGELLDLICISEYRKDGSKVSNRFGMAMRGQLKNRLIGRPDLFNKWVEPLWKLPNDEVFPHLQRMWESGELSGAGNSLPSAILYLRDPDRYGIWISSMQKALESIGFDSPKKFRSATAYRAYLNQLDRFRKKYAIPSSGLDLILWQINTQYQEVEPLQTDALTMADLAEQTGFDEATLRQWISGLERKGQAILYGPPGTGKTHIANAIADFLVRTSGGFKDVVQFHPAYSYEDFIQGIRPESNEEGTVVTYPVRAGHFLEFCRNAETHGDDLCVLVIDEINRANLSRVFGELMYLLEYRKQAIKLAGTSEPFSIPENVLIIGTMNTADRSIALVDHALRRRFAFIPLRPEFNVLRNFHRQKKTGYDPEPLINVVKQLNKEIGDPHYELGISYFMRGTIAEELESIWCLEIEPYLEEYFFDQPEKVNSFRWDVVKKNINPKADNKQLHEELPIDSYQTELVDRDEEIDAL